MTDILTDEQWIELMHKEMGRRTINENRAIAGLPPVKGGDIAHVDWLRQMAGLSLRPKLTLVPGFAADGEES